MENKPKKQRSYLNLFIRRLLSMKEDKAPEEETIASIKAGIDFRGANLWILIFAIFVASLGLNTNSAAVIIGAMLISPLMGPIVGMGLGVGIYDFELLKRAFRSFATATIFSVLTATFYFAITPINEAQSELLARTSPTIYDVLIALFGGLAGIVALCSTGQRGGNVIPGVAIATAIMPPLCTTGFGLATGNWLYAAGAFYLYLINSIFIALATFVGVNILDFKKKVFVDKQREKRVKHIIITIAVLTMLPSALLTYTLVREDIFMSKVNNFVTQVVTSDQTQVITKKADYRTKEIRLVTIGEEIAEKELEKMKVEIKKYINQNMYDENKKSYIRNTEDRKMDISILGATTPFSVFKAKEKKIQNTVERINLSLRTYTGGYQRFEDDNYMNGNPWPIANLWITLYYLEAGEKKKAKECFDFVIKTVGKHYFLGEQVNNETLKPNWVIGLGWSHAMFIIVLERLYGKGI